MSFPNTPAGEQARWLFGAVIHLPIPTSEISDHFDTAFLARSTPTDLSATFTALSSFVLDAIASSTSTSVALIAIASGAIKVQVIISVDSHGLISAFQLQPVGVSPTTAPPSSSIPTSWAGFEHDVVSVAPKVRFLVASVSDNSCHSIEGIDATTVGPLASSFKLYVLDALANAISSGKVSWQQQLTVTSAVKSGGSGTLEDEPNGTRVSVQHVATLMISISDNTAADMLIDLLGRNAVEQATRTSGMADPSLDIPFLTTREQFILKLDDWPKLADRYLALASAKRLAFLTGTVDPVSASSFNQTAWLTPRDINSIEWFATPMDLCRVYASLAELARQPKLAPLATILSLPGNLGLSASQWRTVWYKGGSESGVLTVNYLATTKSGRSYVVSVLAEDSSAPISSTADETLNDAVKGAFGLVAH